MIIQVLDPDIQVDSLEITSSEIDSNGNYQYWIQIMFKQDVEFILASPDFVITANSIPSLNPVLLNLDIVTQEIPSSGQSSNVIIDLGVSTSPVGNIADILAIDFYGFPAIVTNNGIVDTTPIDALNYKAKSENNAAVKVKPKSINYNTGGMRGDEDTSRRNKFIIGILVLILAIILAKCFN